MRDEIYNNDSKPHGMKHIENVITNILNTDDRKVDTYIYFGEIFLYLHEMFLDNVNASLSKSFSNDNIYNFASLSEDKKMSMLQSVLGMHFEVAYKDGIVIKVVSCSEFFKSLLRKSCEEVGLVYSAEKNNGYQDEITYVFKLEDEINSPDKYLKFMESSAEIKVIQNILTVKKAEKLVRLCNYDVGRFTFNLKNLMQKEYNKRLLIETKDDDLTDYIKKIYENVA